MTGCSKPGKSRLRMIYSPREDYRLDYSPDIVFMCNRISSSVHRFALAGVANTCSVVWALSFRKSLASRNPKALQCWWRYILAPRIYGADSPSHWYAAIRSSFKSHSLHMGEKSWSLSQRQIKTKESIDNNNEMTITKISLNPCRMRCIGHISLPSPNLISAIID